MKEFQLEGKTYYFTGKSWLNRSMVEAPLEVRGKLNNMLKEELHSQNMTSAELYEVIRNLKEGKEYQLTIVLLEEILIGAECGMIKMALPILTSCYRNVGKPQKAVEIATKYLLSDIKQIETSALYTSLAAAYCDLENYHEARRYANMANAISKDISEELVNVYARIKKYDGGIPKRSETKEVEFNTTEEWKALNRIWKAVPAERRKERYEDFELLYKSLKNEKENCKIYSSKSAGDYAYIQKLSEEAKTFFFSALKEKGVNLYHSVMAVISNHTMEGEEELARYYFRKYAETRPFIIKYDREMREIINLCYERYHKKRK